MAMFRCQIHKEILDSSDRYHFASNILMVTDGKNDMRIPGLEKVEICRDCAEKFAHAMCEAIGMKYEVEIKLGKLALLAQR